jgi:hypothetical protein
MKDYEAEGLKMGQVDCIAQGDLCVQLGVNSYPTMILYEEGKEKDSYSLVFFRLFRNSYNNWGHCLESQPLLTTV